MSYDSRRTGDRFLDAGSTPAYSMHKRAMHRMTLLCMKLTGFELRVGFCAGIFMLSVRIGTQDHFNSKKKACEGGAGFLLIIGVLMKKLLSASCYLYIRMRS